MAGDDNATAIDRRYKIDLVVENRLVRQASRPGPERVNPAQRRNWQSKNRPPPNSPFLGRVSLHLLRVETRNSNWDTTGRCQGQRSWRHTHRTPACVADVAYLSVALPAQAAGNDASKGNAPCLPVFD